VQWTAGTAGKYGTGIGLDTNRRSRRPPLAVIADGQPPTYRLRDRRYRQPEPSACFSRGAHSNGSLSHHRPATADPRRTDYPGRSGKPLSRSMMAFPVRAWLRYGRRPGAWSAGTKLGRSAPATGNPGHAGRSLVLCHRARRSTAAVGPHRRTLHQAAGRPAVSVAVRAGRVRRGARLGRLT
jgi:hypothetical protein